MGKKKDLAKLLEPSVNDVSMSNVKIADDVLSKLSAIDEMAQEPQYDTLSKATSFLSTKDKKKAKAKEKEKLEIEEESKKTDSFINSLNNMQWNLKPTTVVDFEEDDFLFGNNKKKKKKKKPAKDKEGKIDFNRELEHEFNLLKNNSATMADIVSSLKKNFDAMNSNKSTTRGIGKYQNDLTANLTTAMEKQNNLIKTMIDVKVKAAELNMKMRKEYGEGVDGEGNDASSTAANILKGLIRERDQFRETGNANTEILDIDDADDNDDLTSTLFGDINEGRSDEVDRYLKYENENVEIIVSINDTNMEDYDFIARNENGDVIHDYPLPLKTKLQVNRSTGIAIDEYGEKYHIEWR